MKGEDLATTIRTATPADEAAAIGSALMSEALAEFERDGRPAYLEST